MIFARTPQLFARIFWTPVGAARERSPRIGYARNIGIADQGKDRVIERSRADLDLAALRRLTINGEHQAQKFELLFPQSGFVFLGVVLPFRGQTADDIILFEPGLFHPCQLREELQVAPIARGERDQRLRAAGRTRPFE